MIRRVSALLCAGLLVAGVAGCSSDSTSPGQDGKAAGPVTLTYGIWDANQQPAMQKIVDAFQAAHPDIRVSIQLTPNADYWTKLQTAAASGSAPDVFWMSSTRIGLYAGQGQLLPLSDRPGFDSGKFAKALNDIYTLGGKQYGMPKDYDTIGLWYNKKLFDAAGVKYPDASWTWQDVIDASRRLTDPAKGVWGIASPSWTQENLYNTIHQAGGHVISADRKTSGLADPASVEGLRYALDFVTKYKTSPTAQQMTDTDPSQLFASGKVAMFTDGDWDTLTYKNAPGLVADVAPLPAGPKGRATVVNGLGNVIYAKTRHAAAAWEFVKFLGGREANEIQASTGTVIPAYEGLADTWVKSTPQFNLQIFVDELQNAVPYPVSKNTSAWSKDTQALLDKVWAGQQDLDSAAAQMAATMNAALAKE
ncbi:ABC transporter substrate-binding protein [Kitasatospora sp. NPDC048365]|uniref:ABC transporter substrate-binding protein n=1 Tax=Kitasatospora sp. NPDC048365 TaxID=3364050 RepID=UPI00371942BE